MLSHVIGFDDFPFERSDRGMITVVGTVFAGRRLDGIISCRVTRDGDDSASSLVSAISGSKHRRPLHLVMLQGIALAGFNVVDVFEIERRLGVPVLVVSRKQPDLAEIRRVLLERIPNGAAKWQIIESLGPMEPARDVWIQRVGLGLQDAADILERFAINGNIPEPLRVAHLVAGGLGRGESRGRV